MKFRPPVIDLCLCALLFPYGIAELFAFAFGVPGARSNPTVAVAMSVICGFGLWAHFFATRSTRAVVLVGVAAIMIAQTAIYSSDRLAAWVYCSAFVLLAALGVTLLYRGVQSEKTTVRWVSAFDVPLSAVWVASSVWSMLWFFATGESPVSRINAFGFRWWGVFSLIFPILTFVAVGRGSTILRLISIAGCGIVTGVIAIVSAVYEPSAAGGVVAFSALYLLAFAQTVRGHG